jgi:hypothetical protein
VPRPANRSQLMDYFGAIQRNPMWSWCAVNEDEKKVYLSVWTDHKEVDPDSGKPFYIVQEPGWGVNQDTGGKSPARNDHDEKLAKIFEDDYEAYGYFVEAKDKRASPREIADTKTSFIFQLKISKLPDGTVIGHPLQRIEVR